MNVLIAGGSGLVGLNLSRRLLKEGHQVSWLGRTKHKSGDPEIPQWVWNPSKREVPQDAFQGITHVVNLSGANVGDKRWSAEYKKVILTSRVDSTATIIEGIEKFGENIQCLFNASAIGIYGDGGDMWFDENSPPGSGFLSEVCYKWEEEAKKLKSTRLVIGRIGLVMAKEDGFYKSIAKTIQSGFGSSLGSGKQWQSTIHIDDICGGIIHLISKESCVGTYNLVAPLPSTNLHLTIGMAMSLGKKVWLPNVPSFALKLLLGQFSEEVLKSCRCSSQKLVSSGYKFKYPILEEALKDLAKG